MFFSADLMCRIDLRQARGANTSEDEIDPGEKIFGRRECAIVRLGCVRTDTPLGRVAATQPTPPSESRICLGLGVRASSPPVLPGRPEDAQVAATGHGDPVALLRTPAFELAFNGPAPQCAPWATAQGHVSDEPTHGCASMASNMASARRRMVACGVVPRVLEARGAFMARDDGVACGRHQVSLVGDVPVNSNRSVASRSTRHGR